MSNTCNRLKVTGYGLGCVLRSKRGTSQCSLAPDYGYKRWSTDREAPRAYTQPEGIGCLVGTVSRGQSNFVSTWTKIWPAELPKVTNDTLNGQFLTYSRARQSGFLQALFGFREITSCPVKLYAHLMTFRLCKITTANDIKKNGSVRPCMKVHR